MTEKAAGNTHDQGADRSVDRKPREMRGELIERLERWRNSGVSFVQMDASRLALLDTTITALAAQDARIKELEELLKRHHRWHIARGIKHEVAYRGSNLYNETKAALTKPRGPLT